MSKNKEKINDPIEGVADHSDFLALQELADATGGQKTVVPDDTSKDYDWDALKKKAREKFPEYFNN